MAKKTKATEEKTTKKTRASRATKTPRKTARVTQPKQAEASVADTRREIQIEFYAPESQQVCVAASFNDWNPEAGRLERTETGHWRRSFELEPGIYEYRIWVDGHWVTDDRTDRRVANPFGSENSVLEVQA